MRIGADPEFLVKNKTTNEFVPIIGMLGGTKESPMEVHKGAVQEDGCAAEINIDPASDKKEFISNINVVRDQLEDMLKANNLVLSNASSAEFSEHQLTDPRARVSGCDPDYNVYANKANKYPSMESSNVRHAGGHIHVGSDYLVDNPSGRDAFIQLADIYIGIPLLMASGDFGRLATYGKLGNYRPKEYGVEYRTPSNFWLSSNKLIGWVYDTISTVHELSANRSNIKYLMSYNSMMREYIELKQYDNVKKLLNKLDIKVPKTGGKDVRTA